MEQRDGHYHKMSQVVVKCRKIDTAIKSAKSNKGRQKGDSKKSVINCRKLSQKYFMTFYKPSDILSHFMSMEQRDGNCPKMS